jgi:RNA polymerase sigma factor (sigma-70 family)
MAPEDSLEPMTMNQMQDRGEMNHSDATDIKVESLLSSRDALLGYVRKKVGDPVVAEDILQESLVKAIKSASTLRDDEKLLAWFYRILDNTVTDYHRRRQFEQRVFEPVRDDESGGSVDPEDFAQVCGCLRGLLATMKPDYAELIEELELGDGDPEAVAQRMGITRNNLKVKRHRARTQLRERLEQTCRACAKHGCLDCSCGSTATA